MPALVETVIVYVANSAPAQAMLGLTGEGPAREVMKPQFFLTILGIQGALAFFLTAYLAPVLVSPDLVNGALPLYL